MPPDELDDVGYLGSWQRDASARVGVQGLLRRAQQVRERETVLPGEQLVRPTGAGTELVPGWSLRLLRTPAIVRPDPRRRREIRRPAEEPEHGRLHPGFGRYERDAEPSSHGQPDVSDKVGVDVAPLAREVDCRAEIGYRLLGSLGVALAPCDQPHGRSDFSRGHGPFLLRPPLAVIREVDSLAGVTQLRDEPHGERGDQAGVLVAVAPWPSSTSGRLPWPPVAVHR